MRLEGWATCLVVAHPSRRTLRALLRVRWCGLTFSESALRISCGYDHFAGEALGAPVEAHFAIELFSNHALHDAHAKAAARQWLDGRPTRLDPAQDNPAVGGARPLDLNLAGGHR